METINLKRQNKAIFYLVVRARNSCGTFLTVALFVHCQSMQPLYLYFSHRNFSSTWVFPDDKYTTF